MIVRQTSKTSSSKKLRTIRNARSRASQPQAQISWAPSLNSKHSKPIAIFEVCHCVGCFQRQESSFPKTSFPSSTKVKALPMNAESRPLSYLQMNQLCLRNNWVKFQATGKLGMVFKGIYNGMYLKSRQKQLKNHNM